MKEIRASIPANIPVRSALRPRSRSGSRSAVASAVLTDRSPDDGIDWDSDLPGLGLRTRCGRQTWVVQYRKKGRSIRRTLGAPPTMDRDTARIVARDRLALRSPSVAHIEPDHDTTTRFEEFLPVFLKHSRNRWKAATHANVTTMSRRLLPD
ncbi:MAG: Arm DNA-binding domain-containing protein, partial [Panacagrimonas sp.]